MAASRAPVVIAKLLTRFPQVARLHLAQAHLHRRMGKLDLAAEATQRALACEPDDVAALRLSTALRGEARPVARLTGVPAPIRLHRDFFDPATHRQLLELALVTEPLRAPSSIKSANPRGNLATLQGPPFAARFRGFGPGADCGCGARGGYGFRHARISVRFCGDAVHRA